MKLWQDEGDQQDATTPAATRRSRAPEEEQIRPYTIGELKPLAARISIEDYDPRWPEWFELEAGRVRSVLGPAVLRIEHAGSISVPGLAAKPIIDMVVEVPDHSDEEAYWPALEAGRLCSSHPRTGVVPTPRLQGARHGHQRARVFSRLPGNRPNALIPRLAAHPSRQSRSLRPNQASLGGEAVEIRPEFYAGAKTAVLEEIQARAVAAR